MPTLIAGPELGKSLRTSHPCFRRLEKQRASVQEKLAAQSSTATTGQTVVVTTSTAGLSQTASQIKAQMELQLKQQRLALQQKRLQVSDSLPCTVKLPFYLLPLCQCMAVPVFQSLQVACLYLYPSWTHFLHHHPVPECCVKFYYSVTTLVRPLCILPYVQWEHFLIHHVSGTASCITVTLTSGTTF